MRTAVRTTLSCLGIVALAACGDDVGVYPGGPAGADVSISITSNDLQVLVGDSVSLGAVGRDEAGNPTPTAVAFASCNSSVVSVASGTRNAGDLFTRTAVRGAGLGTSCVTVSVGGLVDTVLVATGPAGVRITGPDTIGSGNTGQYDLIAVDVAGATLSGTTAYNWFTSNKARLVTDPATGLATGRGTGAAAIQVRAPGGAEASKAVVVVPGVFGGTLTTSSAAAATVVGAARASDGARWDADTQVRLGGVLAYVDRVTLDSLFFAAPATGSTAAQTLAFSQVGPDQLAQNTTFTPTTATTDQWAPGNTSATCLEPGTVPEISSVMTPTGNVYLTHGGFGTGSASRGCFNGGAQVDHWFKITVPAGVTLNVDALLEWRDGSDVDVYVCDDAATFSCPFQFFSGSTTDEDASGMVLTAGTWHVIVSMWSAGSNITNFKFNFTGL